MEASGGFGKARKPVVLCREGFEPLATSPSPPALPREGGGERLAFATVSIGRGASAADP